MKLKRILINFVTIFAIILFFTIIAVKDLFHPQLYSSHDIWHNVARFYHYHHALKDGQLLPTWISNMTKGFGYPLFYFSYHLPWLIGELFLMIGFNFFSAFKATFFISYLLSGLTMYLFTKKIFKQNLAAIVSSVVYLWAPFHFFCIFVSASMGMAWVFVFLPLIFLGLWEIVDDQSNKGVIILAISYAGAILSHFMTALMITPFFILFGIFLIIFFKKSTKNHLKLELFKKMFLSGMLALLLSSFYLIPLVNFFEKIKAAYQQDAFKAIYKSNFVNLNQLVYSKWGYGPIISNAKDGEVSFQIGLAQWLAFFLASILTLYFKLKNKVNKNSKIFYSFIIFFGISIFLMLDTSKFLWHLANSVITLDYPFRLLILAVFFGSLIAGYLIQNINSQFIKIFASCMLIAIAIYTNRNHIHVNMYTNFSLETYVDAEVTTNTYNEYLPHKATDQLFKKDFVESLNQDYKVSIIGSNTKKIELEIDNPKEQMISLPQFNFLGQNIYDEDNNLINIETDQFGRISLKASAGKQHFTIIYQKPLVVKIAYLISYCGIISVFYLLLVSKVKQLTMKKNVL